MRSSRVTALIGIIAAIISGSSAVSQESNPEKPYLSQTLFVYAWPGGYSEIWLPDSLTGHSLVSNIDFTVFDPALSFETPDAIYDLMIVSSTFSEDDVRQGQQAGYVDARGVPTHWPQELPARGGAADFLNINSVDQTSAPDAAESGLFDLLHQYYQTNRVQIDAEAQQREIDNEIAAAAEAARRAAIPPHSGPPVIFERVDSATLVFGGALIAGSAVGIDLNGNGMSDVWERKYSVPSSAGWAHYDGDGFSNQQESALGTDPRSRLSRAHLEMMPGATPEQVALRIETQKGKRYEVRTSYDLALWTRVGPEITGTGEPVTVHTVRVPTAERGFFRYRFIGDIDGDRDGLSAWDENQLGSRDDRADSEGDGMPDAWEFRYGLDLVRNDAGADSDGDGVTNLQEWQQQTDPTSALPRVEVWCGGSSTPQSPARKKDGCLGVAGIGGANPATVVFRFGASMAGKKMFVTASRGVAVEPGAGFVTIAANGEVTLRVSLLDAPGSGRITVRAGKIETELPLVGVPMEVMRAMEGRAAP